MRQLVLAVLLAGEIALFAAMSNEGLRAAFDYYYWADLLPQAAPVLVVALGMTVVMMTAGIDLSVGSTVALIGCVMGCFEGNTAFWFTAMPLGLLLGMTLGFANGTLIARFDIPPIVATLGTMILFRGICQIVMGGAERAPFLDVPGYDWWGELLGAGLVVAAVGLAGAVCFAPSRWRREILMLGGNRVAARYAGIATYRRIVEVYTLMGTLAFVAAWLYTARLGAISESSLTGLELQVIVAVVLGGTRVEGGYGTLLGTALGVMLIAVLDEGLRGVPTWVGEAARLNMNHLEFLLLGALLVLGVWLNRPGGILAKVSA